jgi:hypothetical protein
MLERRRAGEWVARRVWEVPFAHRAKPASRGGHFRVTRHFRHLLEKNLHCLAVVQLGAEFVRFGRDDGETSAAPQSCR